ncbi:MAG: GDP-mannose 4,6-dehydratase [Promethearchaeota archaeon]|jgi:dTDP-L-rhamnose 4-epimerase
MSKKILVIGGAGFIGSHLVDELILRNHQITVYDNLEPQVHGELSKPPKYLSKDIAFILNDINNTDSLRNALKDIEVVIHLAAMVGVGQSMYQIDKYVNVNDLGTARLLDILVNNSDNVKKLIVASSMSTYGEGEYYCEHCNKNVNPKLRDINQLEKKEWELNCPICNAIIKPIPTTENKPQDCTSIYALTKKQQEKMCLLVGETYGIDTTALRFFNVYGSRQALSNPYTGVCAIFSSRLLSGKPPIIYEDGEQTRDFVNINDISQSIILSMEMSASKNEVFNVGTGVPTKIKEVAEILAENINPGINPVITNQYRPGDIRHCYADISKISKKLNFKPKIPFRKGIIELIEWVKLQQGKFEEKSSIANQELKKRGLLK